MTRAPGAFCRGFTLVELLLAIGLLTGGVASAAFLFGRAIYATTDAEALQQALGLAQEKAEELRAAGFDSIASESKQPVAGWAGFSRQTTVSQPPGADGDLKQAVVTVFWQTPEGELSTSVTTYVANIAN